MQEVNALSYQNEISYLRGMIKVIFLLLIQTVIVNQGFAQKFNPVIKSSFSKVGADDIWNNLINKYNSIPFTNDVNPDLTDYVTGEALKGVYTMIAVEEKDIRTKTASRSTDLLRKVFALQD